jgi:hypothetical protein
MRAFASYIFAPNGLIRTAQNHCNDMRNEIALQSRPDQNLRSSVTVAIFKNHILKKNPK